MCYSLEYAPLSHRSMYFFCFQALKKRQEEVEELRKKQDEERKNRDDYDREGRHQVKMECYDTHLAGQLFLFLCST